MPKTVVEVALCYLSNSQRDAAGARSALKKFIPPVVLLELHRYRFNKNQKPAFTVVRLKIPKYDEDRVDLPSFYCQKELRR